MLTDSPYEWVPVKPPMVDCEPWSSSDAVATSASDEGQIVGFAHTSTRTRAGSADAMARGSRKDAFPADADRDEDEFEGGARGDPRRETVSARLIRMPRPFCWNSMSMFSVTGIPALATRASAVHTWWQWQCGSKRVNPSVGSEGEGKGGERMGRKGKAGGAYG
jgi:hypothetical protein